MGCNSQSGASNSTTSHVAPRRVGDTPVAPHRKNSSASATDPNTDDAGTSVDGATRTDATRPSPPTTSISTPAGASRNVKRA